MIIGITGTLGAGKGTVVEFLEERGFVHFSVRDFLIEEIKKRGLEVSQKNMFLVANDLREKKGVAYIVEELCNRAIKKGGDVVIESVRCVGEVEALKRKDGFVLWAVDADPEVRYARIIEGKSSAGDEKRFSFDEFVKREQEQMRNKDSFKQNLSACIEMADLVFRNDWSVGELKGKVLKEIDKLKKNKVVCFDLDEYFMKICEVVARGKSGCVVVRGERILATGYSEDAHAEEMAICQAARMGISIDGATLYCFMFPCYACAKLIISCGIKRVVVVKDYHASEDSKRIFSEAGVDFELLDKSVVCYDKM